jgi:hypothetical protein
MRPSQVEGLDDRRAIRDDDGDPVRVAIPSSTVAPGSASTGLSLVARRIDSHHGWGSMSFRFGSSMAHLGPLPAGRASSSHQRAGRAGTDLVEVDDSNLLDVAAAERHDFGCWRQGQDVADSWAIAHEVKQDSRPRPRATQFGMVGRQRPSLAAIRHASLWAE